MSSSNKVAVITHCQSGLVLNAGGHVRLGNFMGVPFQFWTLEPAGNGKYFIVSKSTGGQGNIYQAMDIESGERMEGAHITTNPKHGGWSQQWFIYSDYDSDIIVSAMGNYALDCGGNLTEGTKLIAGIRGRDSMNQLFDIRFHPWYGY